MMCPQDETLVNIVKKKKKNMVSTVANVMQSPDNYLFTIHGCQFTYTYFCYF